MHPLPERQILGPVDTGYHGSMHDADFDEDIPVDLDSGTELDLDLPIQRPARTVRLPRPRPGPVAQPLILVDPCIFSLVYGRTKALSDGDHVGLENILDSIRRGQTALYQPLGFVRSDILLNSKNLRVSIFRGLNESRPYRWSGRFQWLPCEVAFRGSREKRHENHSVYQ